MRARSIKPFGDVAVPAKHLESRGVFVMFQPEPQALPYHVPGMTHRAAAVDMVDSEEAWFSDIAASTDTPVCLERARFEPVIPTQMLRSPAFWRTRAHGTHFDLTRLTTRLVREWFGATATAHAFGSSLLPDSHRCILANAGI